MQLIYHILNGDELYKRFPTQLEGTLYIMRECLVDGPIQAETLDTFFQIRATFLYESYQVPIQDYKEKTIQVLNQIQQIEEGATIYFWFEDDLFCQVNCWFILFLLDQSKKSYSIHLIRPHSLSHLGFAAYTNDELIDLFTQSIPIELEKWNKLWPSFQNHHLTDLQASAKHLRSSHAFVLQAVDAFLDSLPEDAYLGKPTELIIQLINESKSTEFSTIFKTFCTQAPEYGYSDWQVRRIYDQVMDQYTHRLILP